ncbi:hypothetical protein TRFO_37528 [Tritrichomonas foetus]|uniref:Uncharacterized protein n=1 Tax=Tritrichomonas foetus TaxID=1144522 RepID=A0A1J4JDF1_9EUKA|nr:hypothetical protein TRFO_37528 [Tritrichomonas foetus]|eukprot:OHS96311.1 hypothetical protein TRFO_37528 [Tritrichomonas foetus]
MSDLQMSLTEWPFSSKKTKNHHLSWSPAGFLAMGAGKIVIILYPRKNKVDQILSFNPFDSPITSISWCCGPDSTGQTPLYLFASATSKINAVFNISQFTMIGSFQTNDSIVLSSAWSPLSCDLFYTGESNGDFSCYFLFDGKCKLKWSINVDFPIDFMSFSPFSTHFVVLASKQGMFQVINTLTADVHTSAGQFPIENKLVTDCRFYPFIDDTLLFVIANGVYIYPLSDDALVKFIESEAHHEPILNIAFDGSDETVFVILHAHYAREYVVSDTGFVKSGHTCYLQPNSNSNGYFLTQAMYKNKLAILTKGLYIQFYECKNHKFVSTLVYTSICSKPLDYDIFSDSIVIGLKNGSISISESTNIIKYFHLFEGRVVKVAWLSDTTFIALGRIGDTIQKAFYVDLRLMKFTSLLKKSLETLNSSQIELCISTNHIYYALTLGHSLILVFKDEHNFATIVEDDSVSVTFSDYKDDELWTVSSKWVGKKYYLSHTDKEKYTIIRMTTFNVNIFGHPKSEPTIAVAVNGFLIVATQAGDALVIDWYGSPTRFIQLKFKQIESIEVGLHGRCIIRDSKDNIAILVYNPNATNESINIFSPNKDNDLFRIHKIHNRAAKQLKWLSPNTVLIQAPGKQSLTVVNISDFQQVFVKQLMPTYTTNDFLRRVNKKVTILECVEIVNNYGFGLLGSLLQTLLPSVFSPYCLCANFNNERIRDFLYVINGMLSKSHRDLLRIRKARLEMFLGNIEKAKQFLLGTPTDSSSFSIDVMKAALIESKDEHKILGSSVSALINADKLNDAVDILIFTGQFKEAAELLIGMCDPETVLEIISTRIHNDIEESEKIINSLIQVMKSNKRMVHAAAILIAKKKFQQAAEILKEADLECVGSIVEAIKIDGDYISFVFPQ